LRKLFQSKETNFFFTLSLKNQFAKKRLAIASLFLSL